MSAVRRRQRSRITMGADLRSVTEIPNTPNLNACPVYEKIAKAKNCSKENVVHSAFATRLTLLFFILLGSSIWCYLVRVALEYHRFPYHRHKITAGLVYALPSFTFACVMTSINAQFTTCRFHSD